MSLLAELTDYIQLPGINSADSSTLYILQRWGESERTWDEWRHVKALWWRPRRPRLHQPPLPEHVRQAGYEPAVPQWPNRLLRKTASELAEDLKHS